MKRLWTTFASSCAGWLLAWTALSAGAAEPAAFEEHVLPFFKTYCLRCHNEQDQKGEFRLDTLARDFGSEPIAQRWGEVVFRINTGEMPPDKEPQPQADELGRAVDWISARLKEGEAARMAKRGPLAHYRLSREEYAHTVADLLGVSFDPTLPGSLNEDPRWHGFERIGALLSLSPSHVERYFKAAETVLDLAYPLQAAKSTKVRKLAGEDKLKWLADQGIHDPIRLLLWPAARRGGISITHPGLYRIRIQLSGLQPPNGRAPHLSLWNNQLKRFVFDQDVLAPEDAPVVLDFSLELSQGAYTLINEVPHVFNETGNHTFNVLSSGANVFTNTRDMRFLNPTGYMLFDEERRPIYPVLMVDWIEWEGPLVSEEIVRKREQYSPLKLDAKQADLSAMRGGLKRFATQAWRRPATDVEVERYVKIAEQELAAGENPRSAYRAALIGVLTSKNFYYLEEGSARENRPRVNDWELASRLSYFLWSSLPDDALFASAQAGKLHERDVLKPQLARMLADPKIARFTNSFPKQWLQLHRVGMFPPDPGLYKDYDKWLETSMVLETTHFFATVFHENFSLREFLTSDWTMANPRLAEHYGLSGVKSGGFQKVTLRPEDHRGGLLTHAAILSLTSDGTRHRPVHRGVWVSEAIFGRTPPPPPPNVEPLEPTPSNRPKATIRMQLEAHATHNICASCHQKIDPLGFAFDNFDAIGRWRTHEKVPGGQGDDPPVNASGTLPNGQAFDGPAEFQQLLAQDLDRFAEAFVEQLATYALRRVMTIDDAASIRAIAQASRADGYRLRTVLENLVLSDLFQKR